MTVTRELHVAALPVASSSLSVTVKVSMAAQSRRVRFTLALARISSELAIPQLSDDPSSISLLDMVSAERATIKFLIKTVCRKEGIGVPGLVFAYADLI